MLGRNGGGGANLAKLAEGTCGGALVSEVIGWVSVEGDDAPEVTEEPCE